MTFEKNMEAAARTALRNAIEAALDATLEAQEKAGMIDAASHIYLALTAARLSVSLAVALEAGTK